MKHRVFIALGSNLGDRRANLRNAVASLPPEVHCLAESPVYQTPPWGFTDQPEFLNQVIEAETDLSPAELMIHLKKLETQLGRIPTFRYGPRLVDLDILFYDDCLIDQPNLTIPHPRLQERAFVLVPLADLTPHLQHPAIGLTVTELLANVDTHHVQRYEE
jgi:2-amino-4-hydroxy-6-hydroxymethyldihydropteridine diphosphokinase